MARTQPSAFGMSLRLHRVDAGLTQEELAERALLSARGISDLERGVNRRPRYETVRHLANALQLSPADRSSFEGLAYENGERARVRSSAMAARPTGNFLGAVPGGRLVGREPERERALAVVDAVHGGEGRMLVLAGEPGIGKTRFAQEIALEVMRRGFIVATGRCYEPEQTVPFYPFLEALALASQSAPRSIREAVPHQWAYLGRLMPDEGTVVPPAAEGLEEQQRLFRAVAGFLAATTVTTPVALMLDDIHWADDASLKLLVHLARFTRSTPLLLLGTYRDAEARRQHPLERALIDLQHEGLIQRVHLTRLSEAETAAFITARFEEMEVSPEFVRLIYQRTEGNPYFLDQVLQSLVERGDIFRVDDRQVQREIGEIVVPENVRAVILQRLLHLSPQTQQVLHDASVLGEAFLFEDLQKMTGHAEDELERALAEGQEAGLVQHEGRDRYAFDHALTHQAFYEEIPPRRRRKLHGAAGRAVEDCPDGRRRERASDLTWHFLESEEPDRALPYAMAAGDHAREMFAHAEAEGHYRTALELATSRDDKEAQAHALEQLGHVLTSSGKFDEALAASEQAVKLYEADGNREAARRTVAHIGQIHIDRGTFTEGKQRVQSMLDTLAGSDPSHSLAALYSTLNRLHYRTGRYSESLAAADQGAEVARALEDDRLLAHIERDRAQTLLTVGRAGEARLAQEAARTIACRIDDPSIMVEVLAEDAGFAWVSGPAEEAKAACRRAMELAERLDDREWIVRITQVLAAVQFDAGEWQQAEDHARSAVEVFTTRQSLHLGTWALGILTELLVLQGRWAEAEGWLEECRIFLESAQYLPGEPAPRAALAVSALLQGRPQAALSCFTGELGAQRSVALAETSICTSLPYLAWAQLDVGEVDQAEATVLAGIELAEAQGCIRGEADALCVYGMVLKRQGRRHEAMETLERTVRVARRLPYPFGEARALYEWGQLAGRDSEVARKRLTKALEIFRRLGAEPFVTLTLAALSLTAPPNCTRF